MTPVEFYLWLNGYLEALETEGIETCKIKNIREKMTEIKNRLNQERVVFGPNVNQPQQSYVSQTSTPR
jgi:glutathionyl-hydroquinone reductase